MVTTDIRPELERAERFGLKPAHIADLLGIASSKMSRAKNGLQDFDAEDFRRIRKTVDWCEELSRRAPLSIAWSDLRAVKMQLESLEAELRNPPPEPSDMDKELLRIFASDEPAAEIASRLGITTTELLQQIDEAIGRFQAASFAIREQQRRQERAQDPDQL